MDARSREILKKIRNNFQNESLSIILFNRILVFVCEFLKVKSRLESKKKKYYLIKYYNSNILFISCTRYEKEWK